MRIGKLFEQLRTEPRAALIAYLTAGDPAPGRTASLVAALERGGADLIELGVPFSDPVADGPVIQRASERALKAGTTVARVLEIAREIRSRSEIPLLLFTYLNPALRYGFDRLAKDAAGAGIDGCLFTDLSVEEAAPHVEVLRRHKLDTVFLAAPTSTPERRALVARYSTGFVYLVSRTGVTGEQDSLSKAVAPLVASMRQVTSLPLAVGFGVSKPEHAAQIAGLADGVVVGSAVVRAIEEGGAEMERRLERLARALREGIDSARAGRQA